jgi:hypothetical protein
MSFHTAESKSPKYFSLFLYLTIRYHLNSYCSMLLQYLTAFTVLSYLEMAVTTFPALRKKHSVLFAKAKHQVSYTLNSVFYSYSQKYTHRNSVDIV